MCSHVDDFIYGGDEWFYEKVINKLKRIMTIGSEEKEEFKYIGVEIKQENNYVKLSQKSYVEKIKVPSSNEYFEKRNLKEEEKTKYRSLLKQLNWVSQHTRPDISFDVSALSMGNSAEIPTKQFRKLIKATQKMKNQECQVRIDKLKNEKLTMEIFADASWCNRGEKSQVGFVIGLTDGINRCPLVWKSTVAKRVVKSAIESEAQALGEGLEMGIYIDHIWKEVTGEKNMNIVAFTDSKTLERAVKAVTGASSKLLRIELARIRQMLEEKRIHSIKWINRDRQVADGLTREGSNKKLLRTFVGEQGKSLQEN